VGIRSATLKHSLAATDVEATDAVTDMTGPDRVRFHDSGAAGRGRPC